ncbi:MAG: FG-GAP-like repeat-containing protein [Burkholderiaceae bacterium]
MQEMAKGWRPGAVLVRSCVATALVFAVGSTSATGVEITSGGTPAYHATIAVPPGIAGMVPSLVLSYSGGGVNGPLGFGWSLGGASMITRCTGSVFSSGRALGVNYSTQDRLCLDGQRLIETDANGNPLAASPAANGALQDSAGHADAGFTEYRTESDAFARIRAYGMANGAAVNGPAYFKVWTKSGQILEFGAGPSDTQGNSNAMLTVYGKNVATAWGIERASDTLGNYIDFKYNRRLVAWGSGNYVASPSTAQEWTLAEIQYTGTAGQAPANKVVFEYEDRASTAGAAQDRSEAYHFGSKMVSVRRLKAIRTYINWPGPALGVDANGAPVSPPANAVKVKAVKLSYNLGGSSGRSRLYQFRECVGGAETSCMPQTTFVYNDGTTAAYTRNTTFASALGGTTLMTADGKMNVVVGDFDGDGRSDILRYSDTPSQNALYLSQGKGAFGLTSTNLTASDDILFKSDGCYWSTLADFNGDGKTDILRAMRTTSPVTGASCGTIVNRLYLSQGNGQFTKVTLPSNIDLTQVLSTSARHTENCNLVTSPSSGLGARTLQAPGGAAASPSTTCTSYFYTRTAGHNFYAVDLNGDGILDLVTSGVAAVTFSDTPIGYDDGCTTCTHVYLGSTSGTFTELATTNVAQHSLYSDPYPAPHNPYLYRPAVADANGDGLSDLSVASGTWTSNGDGNFTQLNGTFATCNFPMDFNGDGAVDCLTPMAQVTGPSVLSTSDGSGAYASTPTFNLVSTGQDLTNSTGTVGITQVDVDGDGRTDIIRWEDDPTKDVVYLSNGDGSFRQSADFNLNTSDYALKKSDGTRDFIVGDFTGDGNVEILRLVASASGSAIGSNNQLFTKAVIAPPDQLAKVITPSGIQHTLTWVTLPDSASGSIGARYQSAAALGTPGVYPLVDLNLPIWVVATVTSQTGVAGGTVNTEYAYAGMQAAADGRGMLGFMKMSEQHVAPDNSVTRLETSYLRQRGYVGSAGVVQSYDAGIGAGGHLLSETTNAYCDTTSTASPPTIATPGQSPTPCPTTALVQRPYLYQTLAEGWDIDAARSPMPVIRTTNVYDNEGNPASIVATTTGSVAGVAQTSTKTVTNTYSGDDTAGDHWVLAKLRNSTVRTVVNNSIGSIATGGYTAPPSIIAPPGPATTAAVMSIIETLLLSD